MPKDTVTAFIVGNPQAAAFVYSVAILGLTLAVLVLGQNWKAIVRVVKAFRGNGHVEEDTQEQRRVVLTDETNPPLAPAPIPSPANGQQRLVEYRELEEVSKRVGKIEQLVGPEGKRLSDLYDRVESDGNRLTDADGRLDRNDARLRGLEAESKESAEFRGHVKTTLKTLGEQQGEILKLLRGNRT